MPTLPSRALVPADELADDELILRFEDLTLDPRSFRHAEHVRLAFAFLKHLDLFEALERYRRGLKGLAEHHGAPRKYHETVTCGMMVLVHERMVTRPGDGSWQGFVDENPDLLRWLDGAFFEHYPREVLQSELARSTFVLPHSVPDAPVGSGSPPMAAEPGPPPSSAGGEE